jgi:ammonia channel protein AmtB
VGLEPQGTIPHLLFMASQATFAIITAALVSGAIVGRMRFGAYLAFITLWSLVVYAPVAHWVWGGGFLAKMGALDFAGGTVVHVNAATAAFVAAVVIGAVETSIQAVSAGTRVGVSTSRASLSREGRPETRSKNRARRPPQNPASKCLRISSLP